MGKTHQVGPAYVEYTQLYDGDRPAGSAWNAKEEIFRKYFRFVVFGPAEQEAGVATLEEANASTSVTKQEFREHWGSGASWSWGHLKRLSENNPDFPLQFSTDGNLFQGNLDAALLWLEDRYRTIERNLLPCSYTILERVRNSRDETE